MLTDSQIKRLAETQEMIAPFVGSKVSKTDKGINVISYGLDSTEYCPRLSSVGAKLAIASKEIDVKNPGSQHFKPLTAIEDDAGTYFVLPPFGRILGVSVERFKMPKNVTAMAFSKSTLSRLFVVNLTTPLEPGWQGHITFEIVNLNDSPVRVYANEGVCSLRFFQHDLPETIYNGKYQGQGHEPIAARM
jgi:dCTP deaminase